MHNLKATQEMKLKLNTRISTLQTTHERAGTIFIVMWLFSLKGTLFQYSAIFKQKTSHNVLIVMGKL